MIMIEWYYEKTDNLLDMAECFIDKAITHSVDHPVESEDYLKVADSLLKSVNDVMMKHMNEYYKSENITKSCADDYLESTYTKRYYRLKSVINNLKL